MPDRTQMLSVEEQLRGRLKQISIFMAWDRPDTWKVMEAKRIADTALSLSQPEHQGDEEARVSAVVDFLASWRYCPVSQHPFASRTCLEDAAKQLLTALPAQPPAPVLSDEERKRLRSLASWLHNNGRFHCDEEIIDLLRNLASREPLEHPHPYPGLGAGGPGELEELRQAASREQGGEEKSWEGGPKDLQRALDSVKSTGVAEAPDAPEPLTDDPNRDEYLRVITRDEQGRRYSFFVPLSPDALNETALSFLRETKPRFTAFLPAGADVMPPTGEVEGLREGVDLIAAERERQWRGTLTFGGEGYGDHHDDQHVKGELLAAALCYGAVAMTKINPNSLHAAAPVKEPPADWPWPDAWKPTWSDPIRNLVKAGALIAAEIDRLNRKSRPDCNSDSTQVEGGFAAHVLRDRFPDDIEEQVAGAWGDQPDPGGEEDWPEVEMYRLTGLPSEFNDEIYKVDDGEGMPDDPTAYETRRYIPAPSQDSSGPSDEVKEITIAWAEQRDRANKVEAERDRLQESSRIAHEEEVRLTAAAERRKGRAEKALEELAAEFERRAERSQVDAYSSGLQSAASLAREKAAELKGGGS